MMTRPGRSKIYSDFQCIQAIQSKMQNTFCFYNRFPFSPRGRGGDVVVPEQFYKGWIFGNYENMGGICRIESPISPAILHDDNEDDSG